MPERLFQPCIPTRATKVVPTGPDWLHEIKHDGYRLIVQREGDRVRLFTRNGYDWTDRYPLIVEAALRLRTGSFVIDGEAVILRADGTAEFDALHSRQHDGEVRLIAFDALAYDGVDIRPQPLRVRKAVLKKLLARSGDGIQLNPFMRGDIGATMFEHACKMGLEGIVSKHMDRAYRAGRSTHWLKIKNPASPAMMRVEEGAW
jgi:bifunctional non-homologous end joining protein LigD